MSTLLDWRKQRIGPLRPCVLCGRNALMRDDDRQPVHKVCAQALIDRIDTRRRKADAA